MFSCWTSCASDICHIVQLPCYPYIKRGSGEESLLRESLKYLDLLKERPKINITDIDSPVVDVTFEVKWRTDEQTWALFHDGLLYLHSQVLSGDEDFLAENSASRN